MLMYSGKILRKMYDDYLVKDLLESIPGVLIGKIFSKFKSSKIKVTARRETSIQATVINVRSLDSDLERSHLFTDIEVSSFKNSKKGK